MAFARTVQTSATSENHNRGVLGPFRQGRVVRGLHVFGQQEDGTVPASGHFIIYATPIFEGLVPPHADFLLDRFITDRFFAGFAGYLRLPYNVDCYLPLQVEFQRAGWIAFDVISGDVLKTSRISVCSACGLGSVRSAKRRGRTIAISG